MFCSVCKDLINIKSSFDEIYNLPSETTCNLILLTVALFAIVNQAQVAPNIRITQIRLIINAYLSLFFCLLLSLDILPLIVSFTIYHANIVVNTFTIFNYQKLHILKYMEYHCFITFSRR